MTSGSDKEIGFTILRPRLAIETLDTVFCGVDVRFDDGREELAFIHIDDWNRMRDRSERHLAILDYGLLADANTGKSTAFLQAPHRPVLSDPVEGLFVAAARDVVALIKSLMSPGVSEKLVHFYGEDVAFPDWTEHAERSIRRQISMRRLATDEEKVRATRELIVRYLEQKDGIRDRVYPNMEAARKHVGQHVWKVARAQGIVCER